MNLSRRAAYLYIVAGLCFAVAAVFSGMKHASRVDTFVSGMDAVVALLFWATAFRWFRRSRRDDT